MSILGRFCLSQNLKKCLVLSRCSAARYISTSKKNSDTTTIESPASTDSECQATQPKNWVSYGFDKVEQTEDVNQMHALCFFGITITFVVGGFLLAYRPDDLMRDWAQREGFLELRRREAAGLPLVDPNYISMEKICLPSDEDLGDTEIII